MIVSATIDQDGQKHSVLIVEDNRTSQAVLEMTIRDYNADIQVTLAADGKQAFDALQDLSKDPDVILLDLCMPIMDGFEFLDLYAKMAENTRSRVIIVTDSARPEHVRLAETYECVDKYIVKPIRQNDMEYIRRSFMW